MKPFLALVVYVLVSIGGGIICAAIDKAYGFPFALLAFFFVVVGGASLVVRCATGEWPWEICE